MEFKVVSAILCLVCIGLCFYILKSNKNKIFPINTDSEIYYKGFEYALQILDEVYENARLHPFNLSDCIRAKINRLPTGMIRPAKVPISDDAHEKEVMMKAFDQVRKLFEQRSWIMEGRGSYPYNDDRYKEEVRYLFDEFDALQKNTWGSITSKTYEYRQRIIGQFLVDNGDTMIIHAINVWMDWTREKFPMSDAKASLIHLQEEIKELLVEIEDPEFTTIGEQAKALMEFADCMLCLITAAGKSGFIAERLFFAMRKKMQINYKRKWRINPDKTYSHIKE